MRRLFFFLLKEKRTKKVQGQTKGSACLSGQRTRGICYWSIAFRKVSWMIRNKVHAVSWLLLRDFSVLVAFCSFFSWKKKEPKKFKAAAIAPHAQPGPRTRGIHYRPITVKKFDRLFEPFSCFTLACRDESFWRKELYILKALYSALPSLKQ